MSEIDKLCDDFMNKISSTGDATAQAELMTGLKQSLTQHNNREKNAAKASAAQAATNLVGPSGESPPPSDRSGRFQFTPGRQNGYQNGTDYNASKIRLPKFNGKTGSDTASDFIRLFKLMAEKYNWDEEHQKFIIQSHLCGDAIVWLDSFDLDHLPNVNGYPDFLADFYSAFEKQYILKEPDFLIQKKLIALQFCPDTEEIDAYISEIHKLTTRLANNTPASVAMYFIQGLPDQLRQYCLATDNHSLESYTNRARVWIADNGKVDKKKVKINPTATVAMSTSTELKDDIKQAKDDIILTVTDTMEKIVHRERPRERFHRSDTPRPSRSRSYDKYDRKNDNRDRYRNRDRYKDRNHSRSPSGDRSRHDRTPSRDRERRKPYGKSPSRTPPERRSRENSPAKQELRCILCERRGHHWYQCYKGEELIKGNKELSNRQGRNY